MPEPAAAWREGLVSVIIPVFNRPRQLGTAVQSALAQSGADVEVLIVDDGSTDSTPAAAVGLAAGDPDRLRVLRIPNAGPGAAREAGRQMARGEFLQYLDSDDVLLPGKFERQVAALRANPGAVASYGPVEVTDRAGGRWMRSDRPIDRMFPQFLLGSWWPIQSPLYRRALVEPAGGWLALRIHEDWEYDCRVAALGHPLVFEPAAVAACPAHEGARLSQARRLERGALRDRATAVAAIAGHALGAGVLPGIPEMRHFGRRMFLIARECAALGERELAQVLYRSAPAVAGEARVLGRFYPLFGRAAGVLGWRVAGRLALAAERLRPNRNTDTP